MFLESVLEEKAQKKRCNQVVKSLLQAEFLRVSAAPVTVQSSLSVSSWQDRSSRSYWGPRFLLINSHIEHI